jgi:LmbE family N-acetylglucosaminyl deacetylase
MTTDLVARARRLAHATGVPRTTRDLHHQALRALGRRRRTRRPHEIDATRLRILGVSKTYVPNTRSGTEITLHTILRDLSDRGHDVRALVMWGHAPQPEVDGVPVLGTKDSVDEDEQFAWADVVLATGDARGRAMRAAAIHGTPLAFYVQVGNIPRHLLWGAPDLTVFNSAFVARQYPWITGGLTVRPPVVEADYLTASGDAITLVNLVATKGGELFYELAARLPDRHFIGVRSWGRQIEPDPLPANVEIVGPVRDMREVYGRTRVLLMPSAYESFGRVAVEAAASGIPTVAHPAPGLRDALGDGAIWADRRDADAWERNLRALDDPAAWHEASRRARRRFEELDSTDELDVLEQALVELAANPVRPGAPRNDLAAVHQRWLTAIARDVTTTSATRRAMVLAPHPDDETLACGATIMRKVDAGTDVLVVIATDGSPPGGRGDADVADHAARRRAECSLACERLGLREDMVRFLDLPDSQLSAHHDELTAVVTELSRDFAPDEVLVPCGLDAHPDHRALATVVGQLRTNALDGVDVLAYPIWFWQRWAWTARWFSPRHQAFDLVTRPARFSVTVRPRKVDARGLLGRKRHALEAHESQLPHLDDAFLARQLQDFELFFPYIAPIRR